MCKGYTYCTKDDGEVADIYHDAIRCLRVKIGVHFGDSPVSPLVHVVKSYLTARWLYRELKNSHIIIETNAKFLNSRITRYAAERLVHRHLGNTKMKMFQIKFAPFQDLNEIQQVLGMIIEEMSKKGYAVTDIRRGGQMVFIYCETIKRKKY